MAKYKPQDTHFSQPVYVQQIPFDHFSISNFIVDSSFQTILSFTIVKLPEVYGHPCLITFCEEMYANTKTEREQKKTNKSKNNPFHVTLCCTGKRQPHILSTKSAKLHGIFTSATFLMSQMNARAVLGHATAAIRCTNGLAQIRVSPPVLNNQGQALRKKKGEKEKEREKKKKKRKKDLED